MTLTFIRKSFFLLLCAGLVFALLKSGTVQAQGKMVYGNEEKEEQIIVLELFTSSDCIGCILAESKMYDLSLEDNKIALSCHIDGFIGKYGYSDKTADFCTDRQWYYNQRYMDDGSSMYLPQMVINGGYPFRAVDENVIDAQLRAGRTKLEPIEMNFVGSNAVTLKLPEGTANHRANNKTFLVTLIRYSDSAVAKMIPRGMTEPRVIRYTNVIHDIRHIGKWYGYERSITVPLDLFAERKEDDLGGWVAFIQYQNGDPIVATGHLKDPEPPEEIPTQAE